MMKSQFRLNFFNTFSSHIQKKKKYMNEDRLIQEEFGKKQSFRVPEGYFEHFADEMLAKLPDEGAKVVKLNARKPWKWVAGLAAAACFGGLVFYLGNSLGNSADRANSFAAMPSQNTTNDDEFDDMVDYAMMDVSDIYYACAMDD